MKHVVTIQVELATRPNIVPVEVTIEYHLENDGVGHYEYWGATGYNEGNTFIEVDEYHYDNSSFTPEEQEQINAEIDSQIDAIVDTISIDSAVDDDYEPEYDTHHDYEYDV